MVAEVLAVVAAAGAVAAGAAAAPVLVEAGQVPEASATIVTQVSAWPENGPSHHDCISTLTDACDINVFGCNFMRKPHDVMIWSNTGFGSMCQ